MASLNTEKILSGTPEKIFLNARAKLEKEYNSTTAMDFFYSYSDAPLSFILAHSREIFSESFYGYGFYAKIMDENIFDTRTFASEAEKLRAYIDEAREKRLPEQQISMYDNLLERVIGYDAMTSNLSKCFNIAASSGNGEEFISVISDYVYDIDKADREKDSDFDKEMKKTFIDNVFGLNNVYCKITCGVQFCMKFPEYIMYLVEAIRELTTDITVDQDLGDVQRLSDCISIILRDDAVREKIKSISGGAFPGSLYDYMMRLATKDANLALNRASEYASKVTDQMMKAIPLDTPSLSSSFDPALRVEEICSTDDYANQLMCAKYDNLNRLRSIYEAKAEAASVEDPLIYENAEDILCGVEAAMSYMEWEDDGQPNAVLQKHIMTSKEKAESDENEKKKQSLQSMLHSENMTKDANDVSETELCKQIQEEVRKISNIDAIAHLGTDDAKIQQMLKESRQALSAFCHDAKAKKFTRALKYCDALEEEINVNDPMYESVENETDRLLYTFLEEEDEEGKKVVKPKTDLATKIQNKALDHAAKDEERLAKQKEKGQKIKNAANAVASTPKRVSDDLKKFVADFDKWDDNRRKEFLLKPGYRHKIMKHFKNAIMMGSVASINLALVPMLALIHHCSKTKDNRIRNELSKELENEIHICEEKINDANSAGDNKTKYELMRIKDKLEAEKTRVRTNSNYM